MTDDHDRERRNAAAPGHREAVRAGPGLDDIVVSLLLVLFPDRQLYRGEMGGDTGGEMSGMTALSVDPPLGAEETARLERYLHELVERPEWRARHAVVREVQDRSGTRLELRTPIAPADYRAGEALVGPFDDESAADAWGAEHASDGCAHDAIRMAGAWMCDVFDAGQDLAPGWDARSPD